MNKTHVVGLGDNVRAKVLEFMLNGKLFTALDVTREINTVFPFARHREVRDFVRGMFASDIQPNGWTRTPIGVTLSDGTQAEALCYHPDSILDPEFVYYQKPVATQPATTTPQQLTFPNFAVTTTQPVVTATTSAPTVQASATAEPFKDRWMQLFNSAPSLFPLNRN